MNIFHIAHQKEWFAAKELNVEYWPVEPTNCDFIHCSFRDQVLAVADFKFRDLKDLVLLELDANKVAADLKVETFDPNSEKYPHLYRGIYLGDVIAEYAFPPLEDGNFELPEKLK